MDIYEQMEEIVINGKIKKLIIIGAGGMGRTNIVMRWSALAMVRFMK